MPDKLKPSQMTADTRIPEAKAMVQIGALNQIALMEDCKNDYQYLCEYLDNKGHL
jgi:hypothetical protein